MAEPWLRQKGETRRSFAKFAVFRDLGPHRSLPKLRQRLTEQGAGVSLTRVKELSAKWSWFARADAYDADVQHQARIAHIEGVREMNERHITLSRVILNIVAKRLAGIDPETLSPSELARWVEIASRLERLSRGEATERVDVYTRVRELAKEMGLSATEEAEAVAAAERIVKGES